MSKENLVAACGLYCGACEIYRAEHDGNQVKTEEIMAGLSARTGSNYTLEDMKCDGCLAGGNLNLWCRKCAIRDCAKEKQGESICSPDCADFPCSKLTDFSNDGMTHHKEIIENCRRLHKVGLNKHAVQEEKRWHCPECKQPMSWYDKTCRKCGAPRSEKVFKLEYNWPPK
jgi:hypothetical protein